MSASMTMPEQIDGLEKLITLASLRKEDIIATQEEARRQLQLTQAEQGRVAEAKSYIAKHTQLMGELQARENTLEDEKARHNLDVKQHTIHVASENTRLEAFSATLDARKKEQDVIDTRQRIEAERLAGRSVDMEREHREAISSVQKQEVNNTSVAQANAVEKERLQNWEATLKKKAQSLREQAANF